MAQVVERLRREAAPTRRLRLYEAAVRVDDDDARLSRRPALRALYAYLREHPLRRAPAHELRTRSPTRAPSCARSVDAGLVRMREEETYRAVLPPVVVRDRPVTLTAAQQTAVDADRRRASRTGSRPGCCTASPAAARPRSICAPSPPCARAARSALVLVPEISLTHQLVERVRARFGDAVAVLHSQLGVGERWDEWRRIARGEARIVVGARSAVFAPLRDLGLIIVDEEHDAPTSRTTACTTTAATSP